MPSRASRITGALPSRADNAASLSPRKKTDEMRDGEQSRLGCYHRKRLYVRQKGSVQNISSPALGDFLSRTSIKNPAKSKPWRHRWNGFRCGANPPPNRARQREDGKLSEELLFERYSENRLTSRLPFGVS
jgi:hypothetical protein